MRRFLQDQPDRPTKPDIYWSQSLNKAEKADGTTHLENFAVECAALLLGSYLVRSSFTIRSDHDVTRGVPKMTKATAKNFHQRLRLPELEFNVVHRVGIKLRAKYAILGLQRTENVDTRLKDCLPVLTMPNDTSSNKSYDLKITDAEYDWCSKLVRADETNLFALWSEDTGNTAGTDFKHIGAFSMVFWTAKHLGIGHSGNTAEFYRPCKTCLLQPNGIPGRWTGLKIFVRQ